jgi:hypothetical protein
MSSIAALDPIEARFLAKVAEPDENGCHLWTAGVNKKGYGKFKYLGRDVKAHRYAAGMVDWPKEIQTRHLCPGEPNPGCVNPEHLTFGTNADNMRDKVEAGRQARLKGADNGNAKLTEEQVIEIRSRYAAGGVSQRKLGDEFGVAQQLISRIIRRKLWAHLEAGQ